MSAQNTPSLRISNNRALFYSEAGSLLARKFSAQDIKHSGKQGGKSPSKQGGGGSGQFSSTAHAFRLRASSRDATSGISEIKTVLPPEVRSNFKTDANSETHFTRTATEASMFGREIRGTAKNLTGLDRRVYSDFNLYTQVQRLQAHKDSGGPVTVGTLRTMIEVLRGIANMNSTFGHMMNWVVETIEDNLFLGRASTDREVVEQLKILKVFQIQDIDVTYRAVANILAKRDPRPKNDITFHPSSFQPEIQEKASVEEKSGLENPQSQENFGDHGNQTAHKTPKSARGETNQMVMNRGTSSRGQAKVSKHLDSKMSVFFKKSSRPQAALDRNTSKMESSIESELMKDPSVNFMVVAPAVVTPDGDTPSGPYIPSDKQAGISRSPHQGMNFHKKALLGVAVHNGERANSVAFRNPSHLLGSAQKSEYGGGANRSNRQSIMTDAQDFEDSENMSVVYKQSHMMVEPSVSGYPNDIAKQTAANPMLLVQEMQKLADENTQLKSSYLVLKQELIEQELQHKKNHDRLTVELEICKRNLANQNRIFEEAKQFIELVKTTQDKMKNAVSFMTAMNSAVLEKADRMAVEAGLDTTQEQRLIFPPNLLAELDKLGVAPTTVGLSEGMEFETALDVLLQIHIKSSSKGGSGRSKYGLSRGLTQKDPNDNFSVGSGKKEPVPDSKVSGKLTQLQTLKQLSRSPSIRKKSMASDHNGKELSSSPTPILKSQKTIKDKSPVSRPFQPMPKRDTLMPSNTLFDDQAFQPDDDLNTSAKADQDPMALDTSRGLEANDGSLDFDRDDQMPKIITIGEKKEYKMVISTPHNDRPTGSQRLVTQKSIKMSRPASPNVQAARKPIGRIAGPMLVRQHSKSINNIEASPVAKSTAQVSRTSQSRTSQASPEQRVCRVQQCPNLGFLLSHIRGSLVDSLNGLNTCLADLEKGLQAAQAVQPQPERPPPPTAKGRPLLQRRETLAVIGS